MPYTKVQSDKLIKPFFGVKDRVKFVFIFQRYLMVHALKVSITEDSVPGD